MSYDTFFTQLTSSWHQTHRHYESQKLDNKELCSKSPVWTLCKFRILTQVGCWSSYNIGFLDILRHRSVREQMATSMATGVTRSWTMGMSCSTSTCHNRVTGGLGVAEVCLPLGSGAANLRTWEFQNLAQTWPLRFGATCWRCWSHFNSIELLSTPSSFVYAKPCQALAAICCNRSWFWCRYRRYLLKASIHLHNGLQGPARPTRTSSPRPSPTASEAATTGAKKHDDNGNLHTTWWSTCIFGRTRKLEVQIWPISAKCIYECT